MSNNEAKPFFLAQNDGFGKADPEDELLHPERNKLVTADSLSETQYFGFSIPEEKVHAICYLWHHPNLHVVSGGLFVWRGVKRTIIEAEICDVRTFMSDRVLKDDLHEYRLENGYGVKILEPLKRFHMTYSDPDRNNAVDLFYEAITPPIMFADGNHFEQALKVTGEVTFRGKKYPVNCFNVRDRSWGKPRSEAQMHLPPQSWMSGVFNQDFAFECNMFDHNSGNPELKAGLDWPDEKGLISGWIWRDGKLGRLVKGFKRVNRDRPTPLPLSAAVDITDDLGRTLNLKCSLVASCPWQPWYNLSNQVSLVRWECEGLVTHGDFQEAYWNDYLKHIAQ